MNAQTLILAILNFRDATGYEIKKLSTDGQFSYFVDISYGSIYPTLARLEREQMVTCRSEAQEGKPDRKVYSITPNGRLSFVSTLSQPPAPDKFKSEFLLLAMNAGMTTPHIIENACAARKADLEQKLTMINELLADCDQPATQWVARYALSCMSSDLAYLDNNKDHLVALAGSLIDKPVAEAAE